MPKPRSCPGPECPGCSSANCYAGGGRISDREIKRQREERDNAPLKPAGTTEKFSLKGKQTPIGKMQRENDLREYKRMPKPKLYADGGEVHNTPEHPDAEQDKELIDEELHNHMGEELMAAFDAKDKKRMMESIEAIVMSALSKE